VKTFTVCGRFSDMHLCLSDMMRLRFSAASRCWLSVGERNVIERSKPRRQWSRLTFVVHVLVHGGTGFSVRLFASEINIRTNGSVQERLRRSEVVAQRCFGVIWSALHQPPESMQL
jgi:hypothetical protein